MYKRRDFIPVVPIRKRIRTERVEVQDLLSARYIGALKEINSWRPHEVKFNEESRLDKIASKHYGADDLWWAIAVYNGIINPVTEVIAGKILKIPQQIEVESALGRANTRKVTSASTLTI